MAQLMSQTYLKIESKTNSNNLHIFQLWHGFAKLNFNFGYAVILEVSRQKVKIINILSVK